MLIILQTFCTWPTLKTLVFRIALAQFSKGKDSSLKICDENVRASRTSICQIKQEKNLLSLSFARQFQLYLNAKVNRAVFVFSHYRLAKSF